MLQVLDVNVFDAVAVVQGEGELACRPVWGLLALHFEEVQNSNCTMPVVAR